MYARRTVKTSSYALSLWLYEFCKQEQPEICPHNALVQPIPKGRSRIITFVKTSTFLLKGSVCIDALFLGNNTTVPRTFTKVKSLTIIVS